MTRWRRFRQSRLALAALAWVLLLALVAILAPLIANGRPLAEKTAEGWTFPAAADYLRDDPDVSLPETHATRVISAPIPYSPNAIHVPDRLEPPGGEHLLGTDELGRDIAARLVHGARVSLLVGIVASALSLLFGCILGALAGYYGGAADWIVSRVIEIVLCFPFLLLVLGIVALFEPSVWTIVIALALSSWTNEARYIRAEFLRIRETEFAQAAKAIGARDARIMFRHLLPNALAPVLVSATFGVANAILAESALSFLGLGVPLPMATWGSILSTAREYVAYAWWMILFPGMAIFTTVAAFNVIGERVRATLDPRSL